MHCIRAFIGKRDIISTFADNWMKANSIMLAQEFAMIFLTNELYDDVVELADSKLDIDFSEFFDYLSPSIYELLLQESRSGKLAYIETDYFGGGGSQSAILFEKGEIKIQPHKTETCWDEKIYSFNYKPGGDKAINIVLKELGIYEDNGKDEFESIGLGNYRRMD